MDDLTQWFHVNAKEEGRECLVLKHLTNERLQVQSLPYFLPSTPTKLTSKEGSELL